MGMETENTNESKRDKRQYENVPSSVRNHATRKRMAKAQALDSQETAEGIFYNPFIWIKGGVQMSETIGKVVLGKTHMLRVGDGLAIPSEGWFKECERHALIKDVWKILIAEPTPHPERRQGDETCPQATARLAVEFADALITELNKQNEKHTDPGTKS